MGTKNIDFQLQTRSTNVRAFVEKGPGSTENSVELFELEPGARHPATGHFFANTEGETLIVHKEGHGFIHYADGGGDTLLAGKLARIARGTPFALKTAKGAPLWVLAISTPAQSGGQLPQS